MGLKHRFAQRRYTGWITGIFECLRGIANARPSWDRKQQLIGGICLEPRLGHAGVVILGIAAMCFASDPARPQNYYVARVTSVVTFQMDRSEYSALTTEQRQSLQKQGMTLIDSQHAMRSPELPLAGYWLQLGTRRFLSDKNGVVRVQGKPANTKNIKIYAHFADTSPIGILKVITFVPEGNEPPISRVELTYQPPAGMDHSEHNTAKLSEMDVDGNACGRALPEDADAVPAQGTTTPASISYHIFGEATASRGPNVADLLDDSLDASFAFLPPPPPACRKRRPCTPGSNAKPGCCLDYNNPLGDGQPYDRTDCAALGIANFIGST